MSLPGPFPDRFSQTVKHNVAIIVLAILFLVSSGISIYYVFIRKPDSDPENIELRVEIEALTMDRDKYRNYSIFWEDMAVKYADTADIWLNAYINKTTNSVEYVKERSFIISLPDAEQDYFFTREIRRIAKNDSIAFR
jgi:hypothetical protein